LSTEAQASSRDMPSIEVEVEDSIVWSPTSAQIGKRPSAGPFIRPFNLPGKLFGTLTTQILMWKRRCWFLTHQAETLVGFLIQKPIGKHERRVPKGSFRGRCKSCCEACQSVPDL
jgi:hypothetical protein